MLHVYLFCCLLLISRKEKTLCLRNMYQWKFLNREIYPQYIIFYLLGKDRHYLIPPTPHPKKKKPCTTYSSSWSLSWSDGFWSCFLPFSNDLYKTQIKSPSLHFLKPLEMAPKHHMIWLQTSKSFMSCRSSWPLVKEDLLKFLKYTRHFPGPVSLPGLFPLLEISFLDLANFFFLSASFKS